MNSRQYVSWFNFKGSDQQKRVGDLSAASGTASISRSCCARAGTCCRSTSRRTTSTSTQARALEDALLDFAGCAAVISHDRWFLDWVATHILAFEGDSQVTWFEGSFEEYEQWVRETRGAEALEPHRIGYKPLVRPGA